MFEKLKCYVEGELKTASHGSPSEIEQAFTRSYGAVMFTINHVLNYSSSEADKIKDWWDDFARKQFIELKERSLLK